MKKNEKEYLLNELTENKVLDLVKGFEDKEQAFKLIETFFDERRKNYEYSKNTKSHISSIIVIILVITIVTSYLSSSKSTNDIASRMVETVIKNYDKDSKNSLRDGKDIYFSKKATNDNQLNWMQGLAQGGTISFPVGYIAGRNRKKKEEEDV